MNYAARLLTKGDEGLVDVFLRPHTPTVYFMRSNLLRAGLVYQDRPFHADYIGAFQEEKLMGVLSHSWMGSVQIFCPDVQIIPSLTKCWRDLLADHPRKIDCFLGPAAQIEAVFDSCGITADKLREAAPETLFALSLGKLVMPALCERSGIVVRRASREDAAQLISWRHDYYVEAIGDPSGAATLAKAQSEITRRIDEGDLFVLEDQGALVSFCGAGGFLPDWKVVGPVWTPPDLRGRGYARAVTAVALATLRDEGASHAVLFARDPQAVRAYRAIGFDVMGDWRLDFLVTAASRL
jgi:GNAT superfamily N-acetyltransferase